MYQDAMLYDLESANQKDAAFWSDLSEKISARSVLELACGTGRILIPLASRRLSNDPSFRAVGIDISEPFLQSATQRLAEIGTPLVSAIQFRNDDMREFDLNEKFDLIICGFNSFMHLHTMEDQIACLISARDHLSNDGIIGIDMVVPPINYLASALHQPSAIALDFQHQVSENGVARFTRFSTSNYKPGAQTMTNHYFYEVELVNGESKKRQEVCELHFVFPRELELLARLSGMKVKEAYSSYSISSIYSEWQPWFEKYIVMLQRISV